MRRRRTRSSACSRTKPAILPAAICRGCASSLPGADAARSSRCCSALARWSRRRAIRRAMSAIRPRPCSAPQAMIQRSLLSYQRAQEEQADRAGVKFLNATRQSPKGMHDTFKRLADQILFAAHRRRPYTQSHPMPAERVSALGRSTPRPAPIGTSQGSARAAAAPRHDARQARRLSGAARYGGAQISDDRQQPAGALCARDRHLSPLRPARRGQPDRCADPGACRTTLIFHELKGQALLEGGKPAEAIEPLRRAVKLAPNPALIQVMLAQA